MDTPVEPVFQRQDVKSIFLMPGCVAFYNPDAAENTIAAIYGELDDPSVEILVADLGDITVCATQLLTLLVTVHIRSRKLEKEFRLCSANKFVTNVLKTTGLTSLFNIFDTRAEALN